MTWLLCDYGMVLCLPQPDADRAALETATGRSGHRLWDPYTAHRLSYDRGDLTAAEYWSAVLGARASPDETRRLTALDTASWLHPNVRSLAAASRAEGRGLRLAIFSNAPVEIAEAIDAEDWVAGFSPRLFSCRLRQVKPDPAAYAAVLDALDAPAGDVVFLDDRPDNVQAARVAGMAAEVFTDPAQIDAVVPG